jgi:hypothetical protein
MACTAEFRKAQSRLGSATKALQKEVSVVRVITEFWISTIYKK